MSELFAKVPELEFSMAHDDHDWVVWVAIADPERTYPQETKVFELGPMASWSRARDVAARWEREHGPNTAEVRAAEIRALPQYRSHA